jgi:hypothetical protein
MEYNPFYYKSIIKQIGKMSILSAIATHLHIPEQLAIELNKIGSFVGWSVVCALKELKMEGNVLFETGASFKDILTLIHCHMPDFKYFGSRKEGATNYLYFSYTPIVLVVSKKHFLLDYENVCYIIDTIVYGEDTETCLGDMVSKKYPRYWSTEQYLDAVKRGIRVHYTDKSVSNFARKMPIQNEGKNFFEDPIRTGCILYDFYSHEYNVGFHVTCTHTITQEKDDHIQFTIPVWLTIHSVNGARVTFTKRLSDCIVSCLDRIETSIELELGIEKLYAMSITLGKNFGLVGEIEEELPDQFLPIEMGFNFAEVDWARLIEKLNR